MKNNKIFLYLIAILILLISGGVVLIVLQNQKLSEVIEYSKSMKAGDKGYDFQVICLNGEEFNTKGESVLMIFFNTGCKSCTEQVDDMQKVHDHYIKKGIKVIGISSDSNIRTRNFILKHKLNFPVTADPKQIIIRQYRVKYFPLLVVMDEKNKILFYQQYGQSISDAMTKIEKIISWL